MARQKNNNWQQPEMIKVNHIIKAETILIMTSYDAKGHMDHIDDKQMTSDLA